jgi:hypothetical protein
MEEAEKKFVHMLNASYESLIMTLEDKENT